MNAGTLTALRGRGYATKVHRLDRDDKLVSTAYSAGSTFACFALPYDDFDSFVRVIEMVAADPYALIIRGTLKPGIDPASVGRRYKDKRDKKTGAITAPAMFDPAAPNVLFLDIDGVTEPAGTDFRLDTEECVEHVIGLLPECFHDASCWWQATSSAGIKPGIRLRLAFMLDRPLGDAEAKDLLADSPVDLSLYNPVQPHYVARPIFKGGAVDPMPRRSGVRRGLSDVVELPAVIEPRKRRSAAAGSTDGLREARGFDGYLARLGDGDGLAGFHGPLKSAIAAYIAEHGTAGTDSEALKARLVECIDAAPAAPGRDNDLARYTSDSFLDPLIGWTLGQQAAVEAANVGPEATPHFRGDELDPAEATSRLHASIAGWIKEGLGYTPEPDRPAPVRGLKAPAGLGKTTTLLEELAKAASAPTVDFYVLTHALGAEVVAKATELGLPATQIRGREYEEDGEPEPMCRKADVASVLARQGVNVWRTLCEGPGPDGKTPQRCEFFESCRYVKQFKASGVRVMPHDYLALPQRLSRPDLVVVDEAFHGKMIRQSSMPIDRLTAPRTWRGMLSMATAGNLSDLDSLSRKARKAIEAGEHPRDAGISEADCKFAVGVEMACAEEVPIWPGQPFAKQKSAVQALKRSEAFRRRRFWKVLESEIAHPTPLQRIRLERDVPDQQGELHDRIVMDWCADLKVPSVPTLVLDADLDPIIARRFWPHIQIETIAARRCATVIQISDTVCSRRRLLGYASAADAEQTRAANRLADVQALIDAEARRAPTLVVSYKAVVEKLVLPPNAAAMHFGNLRGIDRYKGYETVIVVGREQPAAADVEAKARALFGGEGEALALTGEHVTELRGYRMRDGSQRGVETVVHADPRVQALLEQTREREIAQAVDRLRLIHRDKPARVLIVTNLPVDLTIDHLTTWRAIMPNRMERAAARGDAMPLSPVELSRVYPDLWDTAKAAKRDGQAQAEKGPKPLDKDITRETGPFSRRIRYWRTPGQTKPYGAAIRDGADIETALLAVVGPVERWVLDKPEPVELAEPIVSTGPIDPVEPTPLDIPVAEPPPDIPAELVDDWHERAAVREYEAGWPRRHAERLATEDIRALFPAQLFTSCGIWRPKTLGASA